MGNMFESNFMFNKCFILQLNFTKYIVGFYLFLL